MDERLDQDILDKLNQLPRSRKAEWVRMALRTYMNMETHGSLPEPPGYFPPPASQEPSYRAAPQSSTTTIEKQQKPFQVEKPTKKEPEMPKPKPMPEVNVSKEEIPIKEEEPKPKPKKRKVAKDIEF